MPVIKCPSGLYKIGSGKCMYRSKEKANNAYRAYMAKKNAGSTFRAMEAKSRAS